MAFLISLNSRILIKAYIKGLMMQFWDVTPQEYQHIPDKMDILK